MESATVISSVDFTFLMNELDTVQENIRELKQCIDELTEENRVISEKFEIERNANSDLRVENQRLKEQLSEQQKLMQSLIRKEKSIKKENVAVRSANVDVVKTEANMAGLPFAKRRQSFSGETGGRPLRAMSTNLIRSDTLKGSDGKTKVPRVANGAKGGDPKVNSSWNCESITSEFNPIINIFFKCNSFVLW